MGPTTSVIIELMLVLLVNARVIKLNENSEGNNSVNDVGFNRHLDENFNGVYTECFLRMSYPCVQQKTLMYLYQLNNLSEVSVIGDYVKFVKLNSTKIDKPQVKEMIQVTENSSEKLTHLIDQAIDKFFENHVIKFSALGRQFSTQNNVEEFVGRKKRKGGGGGGGGGGHDGGDGGKKKMMMMAMMCMKMKLMMMIPAMMGMMGMMSFKGMMFSMMSFMISKMMLLMKILEKKGGAGGGAGGGGGDGGWAAGGGGGGAWMPAGGQDYAGGGGGYDANGQWQGRAMSKTEKPIDIINSKPTANHVEHVIHNNDKERTNYQDEEWFDYKPVKIYVNPIKRYSNSEIEKDILDVDAQKGDTRPKSRKKRGIIDALQNSYMYWMNKLLGINNNRRTSTYPKYKIVNGVKYVYYPYRQQKVKIPKETQSNKIKNVDEGFKPIITAEDFNKGEIMEGAVESRMNKKKLNKMTDTVNETVDDNPWE